MRSRTGLRILVTRGAGQVAKLSERLRALGAEPIEVPVLEILPALSLAPLDAALRCLRRYDWVVLTSTNAVRVVVERCAALKVPLSMIGPIAAVGRATAEAARDAGLEVSLIPGTYVAESLIEALQSQVAGKHILLARAAVARDVIPDALRASGAVVDIVDAYRNVLPERAPEQLRQACAGGIDAVTFTSSSSVIHLQDAAQAAGLPFPFPRVAAISIGPITSKALCASGWAPAAEANPHDVSGLVTAVANYFSFGSSGTLDCRIG
jgi:uroporphyrinogen-III synthase